MSFVHLVSRSSPKDARFQQEPDSMYSIPTDCAWDREKGEGGRECTGIYPPTQSEAWVAPGIRVSVRLGHRLQVNCPAKSW